VNAEIVPVRVHRDQAHIQNKNEKFSLNIDGNVDYLLLIIIIYGDGWSLAWSSCSQTEKSLSKPKNKNGMRRLIGKLNAIDRVGARKKKEREDKLACERRVLWESQL